jgi:tetrahydromethanopterin S-methyltransferase subunit F
VESLRGSPQRPWKWQGWSFARNGRRYFYIESVQVAGLLVLVVLAILVFLANYLRG